VAVLLVYGCGSCKVVRRAEFLILQRNYVLGMYSQSILIPLVANWLCHELQESFGKYADIVTLALGYLALLDNNRNVYKRVIESSI
jgi:hypothetical protein